MQGKQAEVLFLVSPNFGLLDNWLPVLFALRKKRPDITITALFPKVETVSEINSAEITVKFSESIFNKVVFKSRAGSWVATDSLAHAKELSEKFRTVNLLLGKTRTALRLSGRFVLARPIAVFFEKILDWITPTLTGRDYIAFGNIGADVKAICFDIYAKTKKECRDVLERFPTTPRFSIAHGVEISDFKIKGGDYDTAYRRYGAMVYLYSKYEISAYAYNYGLTDSEMKVVGVPRYEPEWIEAILRESKSDVPASWDRYLFVISRSAIANFFPREQKREALKHIKKLAFRDLHCKIVIKLRLSEYAQKDGTYEEVLGEDAYGKEWIYSSSHPFALGKNSLFGITFYSGVAIDLLALGVPTIQMVDVKPKSKGRIIMEYKKKGLVLGADHYEELKKNASDIIHRRDLTVGPLLSKYNEYFRPVGRPISTVVDDISTVL